jgi:hypothetical protein
MCWRRTVLFGGLLSLIASTAGSYLLTFGVYKANSPGSFPQLFSLTSRALMWYHQYPSGCQLNVSLRYDASSINFQTVSYFHGRALVFFGVFQPGSFTCASFTPQNVSNVSFADCEVSIANPLVCRCFLLLLLPVPVPVP